MTTVTSASPPVTSERDIVTDWVTHLPQRRTLKGAAWMEVPLPLAAVSSGSCIPVIFPETSLPPS